MYRSVSKSNVAWPPLETITEEKWLRQLQMWPGGLMQLWKRGKIVWVRITSHICHTFIPLSLITGSLQFLRMWLNSFDSILCLMLFQFSPPDGDRHLNLFVRGALNPKIFNISLHVYVLESHNLIVGFFLSLQTCQNASSFLSQTVCSRSSEVSQKKSVLSHWLTMRWRPFPANSFQPSLSWEVVDNTTQLFDP